MNKKKILLLAIVVIVPLLITGCGEQKLAEKMIEQQAGGKLDVDVSQGGEQVSVTDKETGATAIYGGVTSEPPANWPSDLPIYNNAKISASMVVAESKQYTMNYFVDDDYAKVADWYKKEMVDQGWTLAGTMTVAPSINLSFTKNSLSVSIAVSQSTSDDDLGKTNVAILMIGR